MDDGAQKITPSRSNIDTSESRSDGAGLERMFPGPNEIAVLLEQRRKVLRYHSEHALREAVEIARLLAIHARRTWVSRCAI